MTSLRLKKVERKLVTSDAIGSVSFPPAIVLASDAGNIDNLERIYQASVVSRPGKVYACLLNFNQQLAFKSFFLS